MVPIGQRDIERVADLCDVRDAGMQGRPSRGVCVLIQRRCCCASSRPNTSSSVRMSMSSHGDNVLIGTPSAGRFKTRDPTMFCIHVVPHLEGVEMTMSSSLKRNRSQRALSAKNPRYRRTRRSYDHHEDMDLREWSRASCMQ